MTATLRATESLPRGRAADRLLDLGVATADPRYPLVRDETGSGRRALDGLDTCMLAGEQGPVREHPAPDRRPGRTPVGAESWPMEKVAVRAIGEMMLGGGADPGDLEQLSWETDAGTMTAVVYRPAGDGRPVVSPADRSNPLQTYVLPVPGQPLVVLSLAGQPGRVPVGAARHPLPGGPPRPGGRPDARPPGRPSASPPPKRPTTAPPAAADPPSPRPCLAGPSARGPRVHPRAVSAVIKRFTSPEPFPLTKTS